MPIEKAVKVSVDMYFLTEIKGIGESQKQMHAVSYKYRNLCVYRIIEGQTY